MYMPNSKRKFGEVNQYLFVQIHGKAALLTSTAAAEAIARAEHQPEDVPTLWARLRYWLRML